MASKKKLISFARDMRNNPTKGEEKLWWLLKDNQALLGKFRRQHPFGEKYIADFISLEHKIVIEVDGDGHRAEGDAERDDIMIKEGYKILRFTSDDILTRMQDVIQKVSDAITPSDLLRRPPPPSRGRLEALIKPRAMLFDWDGTLVDTWRAIIATYNLTRIAMGMDPWDEATARQNIRKSWRDAFPEVFGDRWQEAGKIYRETYGTINHENIDCIQGAFELLHDLHAAGVYTCVVSNKSGPFLRREVTYFNWDNYFTRTVGAGDAGRDKPNPEPVIMALDGSGIAPGPDVWFVGDTGMDLQVAHATGCTPILVNASNLKPGEREQFPPTAEFDDLPSLHQAWISVMKTELPAA